MSIIEQREHQNADAAALKQGAEVRLKYTGQIVQLKRVSEHGISLVCFPAGADYFISNKFIEPVIVFH